MQLERDFRERTQLTEPEREEATNRIARLEGQAPAPVAAVVPVARALRRCHHLMLEVKALLHRGILVVG